MMKKAVITGGTGGIGAQLCRSFSQNGYAVYFTYMNNAEAAEKIAAETRAVPIRADVSDFARAHEIAALTGGADVLVNNAGIAQQKLFCDITEREWDRMFDVNVKGVFNMCHAYVPEMIRRKSGCIINISSVWGVSGASCEVHYSASKAAVIGFTQSLARELGLSGIRVNAVAPGVIDTPMNAHIEDMGALAEETALGRIGTPEEVADAVMWLADGARYVTGQTINVGGGFVV